MHRCTCRRRPGRCIPGFTLIELMVVMGVIVILIGVAALALSGRGREGVALANAQNMVSGMVATARAQAALHQTNARVIVYAQRPPRGDARNYLRALQVVREEPFGSNRFVAAGEHVVLPEGVCVVPSPAMPRDHLNTGVTWLTNPPPVSTMEGPRSFFYFGRAGGLRQFFGAPNANGLVFFIQFGPDGLVSLPAANAKIAVATAVLTPNGLPKFNNPRGVRGAVLRRTGAISFVNDATGF